MSKTKVSKGEIAVTSLLMDMGINFEQEYRFHPTRRWRFDFAIPEKKVAIEIEGAVWVRGRHTRGAGFVADMEKYNEAVLLGWRVLRYSTSQAIQKELIEKDLSRVI